jgi:hypothetical protein
VTTVEPLRTGLHAAGVGDCRACREDLRSTRKLYRPLRPAHRMPLSTAKCTACGELLAQAVVTRGGTMHAGCGTELEGVWR